MSLNGTFTPDNLIAGDAKIVTEDILIPAGSNLARGTVLGRVKQSTPTTGTAAGGNTGNGTVSAVTGGGATKKGTYTIKCTAIATHGGSFRVTDPDGKFVGDILITAGAGGTGVFKSNELNFTVTDGSTDFALADSFTVAVTDGVPATGTAAGGNTGNGTVTEVEGRRDLKIGTYTLECVTIATHGGVFSLTDPDGNVVADDITIPAGAGANIVYDGDQIKLKITDGSTDFALADSFTIAVTISPRQCVAADKTRTNGASEPYAILLEDLDATSASKVGASAISGEFEERSLVFASGNDIEDYRDKMRAVGIFTKSSVAA